MSVRSIFAGIGRRLTQLLLVEEIRTLVALVRYLYFAKLRGQMRCFEGVSDAIAENALPHNLGAIFRSVKRSGRTNVLIRPLSVVQPIRPRLAEAKVLCIGPRAEGELLNLVGHGFRWCNITGLDLISYSPKVDIGDMHKMPYPDDSFDVVIGSRVLGYSEAPGRAAAEFVRVVRSGGVIAVNTGDLQPGTSQQTRKRRVGPGAKERMSALDDLLKMFGDSVDQVFHRNDPSVATGQNRGSLVAVFSVSKGP